MDYGWDPDKNKRNIRSHGVRLADAVSVFEDDYAITVNDDSDPAGEQRYVTLGTDAIGRILVVVFTYRGEDIRLISARAAEPREREQYEAQL